MTTAQRAAQIFGGLLVFIALLGFVASGGSMDADPETAPRLLGMFPVNVLHNVVHLLLGIWGLVAARSFDAARMYGIAGGILYLVLAGLGAVVPNTFGLIPIGGHDVWLHGLLGGALLAVGLTAKPRALAS